MYEIGLLAGAAFQEKSLAKAPNPQTLSKQNRHCIEFCNFPSVPLHSPSNYGKLKTETDIRKSVLLTSSTTPDVH